MDVEKTVLLKEEVRCKRKRISDTSHCADGIGSGAEVEVRAKKLERSLLLRDGVYSAIAGAVEKQVCCFQFHKLLGSFRCSLQVSTNSQTKPHTNKKKKKKKKMVCQSFGKCFG